MSSKTYSTSGYLYKALYTNKLYEKLTKEMLQYILVIQTDNIHHQYKWFKTIFLRNIYNYYNKKMVQYIIKFQISKSEHLIFIQYNFSITSRFENPSDELCYGLFCILCAFILFSTVEEPRKSPAQILRYSGKRSLLS